MIGAGYDNGDVKMWDLRNMKLHWDTNVGNGVCGLEYDRRDIRINKLAAMTLEGGLHVWDCSQQDGSGGLAEVRTKVGPSTVWTGRHSPHNRPVFSTLIGPAPTKLGSHWSRVSECFLRQQSYAIKNQLVASKAPDTKRSYSRRHYALKNQEQAK